MEIVFFYPVKEEHAVEQSLSDLSSIVEFSTSLLEPFAEPPALQLQVLFFPQSSSVFPSPFSAAAYVHLSASEQTRITASAYGIVPVVGQLDIVAYP